VDTGSREENASKYEIEPFLSENDAQFRGKLTEAAG
jgi:hypothetical protein